MLSKGKRPSGERGAEVLAIPFLLVLFSLVGFGLGREYYYSSAMADRFRAQVSEAQRMIGHECLESGILSSDVCANQWFRMVELTNANEALVAQKEGVQWSEIAVYATLLLGSLSSILLYLTLRDTRAMASEQKSIGRAQVRAYLSIHKVEAQVADWPSEEEDLVVLARISIKNSGQSPALGVRLRLRELRLAAEARTEGLPDIEAGEIFVKEVQLRFDVADAVSDHPSGWTFSYAVELEVEATDVFGEDISRALVTRRVRHIGDDGTFELTPPNVSHFTAIWSSR